MLGTEFGIIDLSLAPTPAVGDSVASYPRGNGLEQCGAHRLAALAMLNDAVKRRRHGFTPVCGRIVRAFIPVGEDAGMIAAARNGVLSIEEAGSHDGGMLHWIGHDRNPRRYDK